VNNASNALKPILVNEIFIHPLVNNAGQHEQSPTSTLGVFASFGVVHDNVNK
jgi:hypothetical protein